MTKVIAYTYSAETHCPECAKAAFVKAEIAADADEHGIPLTARDGEGNPIHPIFDTDETPAEGLRCEDCGAEIVEPDPERAINEALEADDPVEAVFRLMRRGFVDERDVGMFVSNYADGEWTHPSDGICEGFAYIDAGGGRAITAAWDNDGFWSVDEMTVEEADAEIAAREEEAEAEEN